MKKMMFLFAVLCLSLGACAVAEDLQQVEELSLVIGSEEISFTSADLAGMTEARSEFGGSVYIGVPLLELVKFSGVDPAQVDTVKAIAVDGYSVSYGLEIFTRADVLVAYAGAEGSMSPEDGIFRMVLPGEEGKLNLRMLSTLEVELR
jgi:hypothetical protein